MFARLNRISVWTAIAIITIVGFVVFFNGLTNAFQGDDMSQIVDNVPVHSISNIKLFFQGGTFYIGNGIAPLQGPYYRPLMTTIFSLLYTIFGPRPIYFHMFQLALGIGSTILLYLFFRYSFKPGLALLLALIFLIHPLNSQVLFSIPSMQDALFFFFGILAIWLLVRFRTTKSLLFVASSLFLCLLSKESGALFVVMALLYLFWWDRKRLYTFIGIMLLPVITYLALKSGAVGLIGANPMNAPINTAPLTARLLTAPSIYLFYFTKLMFPLDLASGYYWVHTSFSIRYVIFPLIVDFLIVGSVVGLGIVIKNKGSKAMFYTYMFFATWTFLGLLLVAQLIPLDMTASETWFYFSSAGVLGMVGVTIKTLAPAWKSHSQVPFILTLCLLLILGLRTGLRGGDWKTLYSLNSVNIKVSPDNFNAYNLLAIDLSSRGDIDKAEKYAERSVNMFPVSTNTNNLAIIYYKLGKYDKARQAFLKSTNYGDSLGLYENLSLSLLSSGDLSENVQIMNNAVTKYPHSSTLWLRLAVLQYDNGSLNDAKQSIKIARSINSTAQIENAYSVIMNNGKIVISH